MIGLGGAWRRRKVWLIALLMILIVYAATSRISIGNAKSPERLAPSSGANYYSGGASWGAGLVVPEGSRTANGGRVDWADVQNVSALFRLPDINETDGTIYMIMSLMTSNGSIIQAAAGLYQNSSYWGTYAMYVANPARQVYAPIISTEAPYMVPGDIIFMSIYFLPDSGWNLLLLDLTNGLSASASFGPGLPASLKVGDQFVFALESYTSTPSVFENMGNVTLYALLINGEAVVNGSYLYSGWNNLRYPLFIVGGASVPNFMAMNLTASSGVVWSYGSQWGSPSSGPPAGLDLIFLALAAAAAVNVVILVLLIWSRGKAKERLSVR
ncbi:MAG: hypothetical protein JRN02_02675 [Nitrososphaerota archaeon]|nr:hypothetical protein [Nitrososphaerota archaeon]